MTKKILFIFSILLIGGSIQASYGAPAYKERGSMEDRHRRSKLSGPAGGLCVGVLDICAWTQDDCQSACQMDFENCSTVVGAEANVTCDDGMHGCSCTFSAVGRKAPTVRRK